MITEIMAKSVDGFLIVKEIAVRSFYKADFLY